MKSPLVSIVIPCYNYAKYVEQAINSALSQTYRDTEIIVINDGSTDESDTIIQKLLTKHTFLYHNQKNAGIVEARNKGIELANGEYIVQLDADDWFETSYIEETVRYALKNKVDIVYTQAAIFGRVEFETKAPEFNLEYLKHDGYIHASALVHHDVFKGRRYDPYLADKGNEDWDLFLDACLDGATAGLVDKPLLHYRKHDSGVSRADSFEGTKKELLVRHHILNKQNAKHPEKMWYFSPYINLLMKSIENFEAVALAESRTEAAEARALHMEKQLERIRRVPFVASILKIRTFFRGNRPDQPE